MGQLDENIEEIKRRYASGESLNSISQTFASYHGPVANALKRAGVTLRSRYQNGLRQPSEKDVWSDEMKETFKANMMKLAEDEILRLLMRGDNHTAQEIGDLIRRTQAGAGYVWETLIKMELNGLVWRAHHFDWRRANSWEITGCGRIVAAALQQTPGA
jgi:DNA-binding MarR family transcriptional regulator